MDIESLFRNQLAAWPLARDNYAALASVKCKDFGLRGQHYRVQFNPGRIRSASAKIDRASLSQRPCFLCRHNRPVEQTATPVLGRYELLVNPYPIFPRHVTIVGLEHAPQRIAGRVPDMLDLARLLPGFTVFYNGPLCGASAPDHMHFQAGASGYMPIETDYRRLMARLTRTWQDVQISLLDDNPRNTVVLEGTDPTRVAECLDRLLSHLPIPPGDDEPRINLLARSDEGLYSVFVFARTRHRPSCYSADDAHRIMVSPASVELGGLFVVPTERDFLRIDEQRIEEILREVCAPQALWNDILHYIFGE